MHDAKLHPGLPSAGLHRQVVFGGLRLSLYDSVKRFWIAEGAAEGALVTKILAALTTGAVAIAVASPTDLVKVSTPGLPG